MRSLYMQLTTVPKKSGCLHLTFHGNRFEQLEVGDFSSWRMVTRFFVMGAEEALGAHLALCDSDISPFQV